MAPAFLDRKYTSFSCTEIQLQENLSPSIPQGPAESFQITATLVTPGGTVGGGKSTGQPSGDPGKLVISALGQLRQEDTEV